MILLLRDFYFFGYGNVVVSYCKDVFDYCKEVFGILGIFLFSLFFLLSFVYKLLMSLFV